MVKAIVENNEQLFDQIERKFSNLAAAWRSAKTAGETE
jgi:hypothetical protein